MENTQVKAGLPAEAGAKAGPKDVFLHLLAIITLYVSVGSFIALIFQYINVLMPDIALSGGYYDLSGYYSSIRWYMAMIIIVFPVYIWSTWFLNKQYEKDPQRKEIKIRKWLLYFTLFAMAIIIIGDLVTLIFNLLQGELTARFLLKILAVGAVSGKVFTYYLLDLRNKAPQKLFAYGVSAVVLIFVAAGFFVAGSPKEARQRQFDDIRVQNLQILQNEIVNYWQQKNNKLPPNLDALRNDISGFVPPLDPETNRSYEYKMNGTLNFSLCAAFSLPSLQNNTARPEMVPAAPYASKPYPAGGGIAQNWDHPAGSYCFDRTIDKDFYKLPPKQ